jgi:hypothetical protein
VSFLPAASFRLLLSGALVSICRPGWFARCERLLLGLLLVLRCAPCGPLYLSGCVSTSSGFHVSLRHGDLLFFLLPSLFLLCFLYFCPRFALFPIRLPRRSLDIFRSPCMVCISL